MLACHGKVISTAWPSAHCTPHPSCVGVCLFQGDHHAFAALIHCIRYMQGAKNIVKLDIVTAVWASVVAGGGAALLGALIGVPLLLRQIKVWDTTM